MKRSFMIFLVTCIACLSASAQETETKQYLPEAGDWSIGIDVKPVFKYVSGLFNNYDKQADLNFGGGQPSIYQPDVDRYITGDLYSLKFVEFHNTQNSTPWAGYRRREGSHIW